ncbi:helix-turn-helix transcriptional regulator [Paenibacillus cremeus]|uniref:Helix-turn-helix transcriptional regulator n=1 Tax=Paenibacillus cremeus TaxID=2163881 RepID=A0A559K8X3_9BACL|nr:AraC family transcriptional regulator [Paenibacillus cremeus]TVY08579.1 helix-turn-helix transcriptional regulator [Paenibacillus cremeus]
MQTILRFRQLSRSLFIRLLASFTLIIVLLSSFNYLSFTFFRTQLEEEIITYNNLNLKQTTDSYETHLQLIANLVLGFYSSDRVQILYKNPSAYNLASDIRSDIQNTVNNPLLYMENLMLVFKDTNFILEKEGSSAPDTMFTKFYSSDAYPYEFWQKQFDAPLFFNLYPAAPFYYKTFKSVPAPRGTLLPVIIKNKLTPGLYMVALLDAEKAYKAFHRSINDNFVMLDEQGKIVYSSAAEAFGPLPELKNGHGYVQNGNYYYFYTKGDYSGLTYVNIIPTQEIGSKVSRLNLTLFTLLLVAIAIGIGTSVLFSLRFNNPVKKIIDSIRQLNTGEAAATGLSKDEFEQINTTIHSLFKTNKDIHQVLDEKNSLLKYYAITNKVKNIHSQYDDFKELAPNGRPFRFVLFQLYFTPRFYEFAEVGEARATYFSREIIRQYMSTYYKDAHTFQVENDQILTVVFNGEQVQEEELSVVLNRLKEVFDHDKEICFLTIALSPFYQESAQFTVAYEAVLELAEGRMLNADTQIIEQPPRSGEPFTLTPSQEQEFEANLRGGNDEVVLRLVRRVLGAMQKKGATAGQIKRLCKDLLDKTLTTLALLNIDSKIGGEQLELQRQVLACHTLEQLETLMMQALSAACELVRLRKDQRDPMARFVLEYLEQHYHEDITLDSVAEKLDISGGYLSSYFKEKTGHNFIDYVHEVRITKARELLLQSELKIQEAASQVGYHNLNSFNRMFKKYTGMTPSEFRRSS